MDKDEIKGFCKSLSYQELDAMEKSGYRRRTIYYKFLSDVLKTYVDTLEESFGTCKPIDTTIRIEYQLQDNGFLAGKITRIPNYEIVVTPKDTPIEPPKSKLKFKDRLKVLFTGKI